MTRALTTLPLPRSLLRQAGLNAAPLRAVLGSTGEKRVFVERGERLLGVRNAPPSVKAAVGLADIRGYRQALVTIPGDLVDYRAAFSTLAPHLTTHLLQLHPGDPVRTEESVAGALARAGDIGDRPLDAAADRLMARTLKEYSERQLEGAASSADWRHFLLGLLTGANPDSPAPVAREGRARVALMGALAGPSDLLDYIEVYGGRVVYDEWAQLAAELALASNPFQALAETPLLSGLAARQERLSAILSSVDAIVLVVEPFCATALEEAWLRSAFRKPLLVVEADGPDHLDATRVMRLENFAALAFAPGNQGGA